jgi:hypothetical protein
MSRSALGGVDHEPLLHQRVVDRAARGAAMGLDDEHVLAPDRLLEAGPNLAVGEIDQVGLAEGNAQVGGDVLSQTGVRAS